MKKVLLFSLSCILFTVLCSCNKSIEKSSSETTSDEYTSATITVEISSDATSDENAYATTASKTSSNCTWSLDGTVLTISGNGKMDLIDNKTKWGKDITEVVIQNGITSIESYAFSGFTNLTNVTIPDSVTTIGESAFERCSRLTNIVIPNSVTYIGDWAFCYTGLTNIVIPDSVTKIGQFGDAFSWCGDLTTIKVEEGNTFFDSRNNCNAIIQTKSNTLIAGCQNTVIPDSVTGIGMSAFGGCTNLTDITIPDSVTRINERAFSGCSGLTSIVIPSSAEEVGGCLFSGCNNLETIKVDEGNSFYDSRDNCNAIINTERNALMSGCKNTEIPDSVSVIDGYAFSNCYGLTSVTIPDSVTSIGVCAFSSCTSLTNVIIPDSVTSISDSAFANCSGLTSVTIPDSVAHIGHSVFNKCAEGFKIYGSKNSETQRFAKDEGYDFVALD